MVENNGKFLKSTISSLGLEGDSKKQSIKNAEGILTKVIESYESNIGNGQVGKTGTGKVTGQPSLRPGAIGLVYGRIQSGKTRAMITTTAMGFDNGFRVAVVMTSNINDLVTQTHLDFSKVLAGASVFTKDDELNSRVEDAKLDLEQAGGRILIITSKGKKSLRNITAFLERIRADAFPMLIFDDEGDQASLDANTYKRTSGGDLTLQPTEINKLITALRSKFPASVYLSVTGTPQALLLQSASSNNRPAFVYMLPFGDGYVGGDHFFTDLRTNPISIVPEEDKAILLNLRRPIPEGLKKSILFFLLSASAAAKNLKFPDKGSERDKGFQFLCHPSLKNNEQAQAEARISSFLTQVKAVIQGKDDNKNILPEMEAQYEVLKLQLGAETPPIGELKEIIQQQLLTRKILVINASNTKRRGIEYGPGFNFLIGGNTLGRGIAIPNLLVTYYVRGARSSQIDTMHQHAMMFGYRMKTLKYTRLFITEALWDRFAEIHYSDQGLRTFIEQNVNSFPNAFPVEIADGLRATRKSVLDAKTMETIWPGQQIFPNYMNLPQSSKAYNKILRLVGGYFGVSDYTNIKKLEAAGKRGVTISTDQAIEIVSLIKTKSKNSWHDKTISDVLQKLVSCQISFVV
jgi:hypothetical protein